MAKHRGPPHEEHADESWLIPYCDLLTLLLALFVVLFAISNVDKSKAEAMAVAFRETVLSGGGITFIPSPPVLGPTPSDPIDDVLTEEEIEDLQLQELRREVQLYLEQTGLISDVSTSIDHRGLVISMNNALFFHSGSAEINPGQRDILVRIGKTVDQLPNYIRIEGHTDTVPIHTDKFPSNWELSSARASAIVRLFITDSGVPANKLMAVGYGEFKPVAGNDSDEGRQRNRRVDVIVLASRYEGLEADRRE